MCASSRRRVCRKAQWTGSRGQDGDGIRTSSSRISLKSRLPYVSPSSGGLSGSRSFTSSSRLRFLWVFGFAYERQQEAVILSSYVTGRSLATDTPLA